MSTRIIFMISFLLPSLLFLSVSADVFVSIDCGSSDTRPYEDSNQITWSRDQAYVRTGESHKVPPNNSLSHVMDTLRVFTANKRNCYLISSVTKGRVLLRASFYYGNYDGKNKPPSFDLSFDGNYWDTVTSPDYVYYEVIYVMKKDSISVCVEQKYAGQFPFLSAIEVRALETWMYTYYISEEYPLFLKERVAYGANSTIRYIDDPYDRIWVPSGPVKAPLTTISSANPFLNDIVRYGDNPPPRIFQNAITPTIPRSPLNLSLPLPNFNVTILSNLYFAEVVENQTRSFQFVVDDKPLSAVTTHKGNVTEVYHFNPTASSSTRYSLIPLSNSTLPPLINAVELFFILRPLTNGTYSGDVEGLAAMQNAFDVLNEWSGDPCLPSPSSWDWINCTSDSTPRVTALFLGGFNLSGKLPDFSSMDALETIDLHNNSLSGPIPDFLGAVPKLKNLNLANNNFNGSVPTSLLQNNGLNLVLSGNPELCTSAGKPCASPTSSNGSIEKNKMLLIMFGVTIQTMHFLFFNLACILIF